MKLEEILSIALLVPMADPNDPDCHWGLPVMLEGSPGIGKSGRVRDAAKRVGLPYEVLYPACHQPEDFAGAPMPDGQGSCKIECILPAIRELAELQKGLILIDEVTCARPAVQGALLGFVYERRSGDLKLPGKLRVMAAGNPPEEAAGGWNLAPPMANRLAWFRIPAPKADEWVEWLLNGPAKLDRLEAGEALVAKEWSTTYPKYQGLAAGFMKRLPGLLHKLPKEGSSERHRAWPSPRTWEYALRASATCAALGQEGFQYDLVNACVGEGAGHEWATWLSEADLPDPRDMLLNGWAPDKKRLDRCIAAYTGMTAYVLNRPLEPTLATQAWKVLDVACNSGLADLAMKPAESLLRAGLGSKSPNKQVADASKAVILRFAKMGIAQFAETR